MKGYSKMKIIHSPCHSRSMTSPEEKKTEKEWSKYQERSSSNEVVAAKKTKNNNENSKNASLKKNKENPFLGFEEEDEDQKRKLEDEILPKLKRNSSVSAASTSSIHSAMKKAFSMRRSTSVSDRYCRIHDQSSALPSPDQSTTTHHHHHPSDDHLDLDLYSNTNADANDGFVSKSTSVKKKITRGRILNACKKLLRK